MLWDILSIIQDNWLLLLIGQYPNGPLGGFAATLILSVLSIALAFPVSVLIALARLSTSPFLLWPATALVYVARGGIVALGRGQMEAARALGNSYLGAMWSVILPQALYNMMPSILSQFVSTIKETTL